MALLAGRPWYSNWRTVPTLTERTLAILVAIGSSPSAVVLHIKCAATSQLSQLSVHLRSCVSRCSTPLADFCRSRYAPFSTSPRRDSRCSWRAVDPAVRPDRDTGLHDGCELRVAGAVAGLKSCRPSSTRTARNLRIGSGGWDRPE